MAIESDSKPRADPGALLADAEAPLADPGAPPADLGEPLLLVVLVDAVVEGVV